jgi:hypothetical protein
MTTEPISSDSPKFCPLRHAITPSPPDVLHPQGALVFKDLPCLEEKCSWFIKQTQSCAAFDICVELSLANDHLAALTD